MMATSCIALLSKDLPPIHGRLLIQVDSDLAPVHCFVPCRPCQLSSSLHFHVPDFNLQLFTLALEIVTDQVMRFHPRYTRPIVHTKEHVQLKVSGFFRRPPPLHPHFPVDQTPQLVHQSLLGDCHGEQAVPGRRRVGRYDCRKDELGEYEAESLAILGIRLPEDLGNLPIVRSIDLESASLRDQWSQITPQSLGARGSVLVLLWKVIPFCV